MDDPPEQGPTLDGVRAEPAPPECGEPATHHVTGLSGGDHRARQPIARVGVVAGLGAALVAIGLGTAMVIRTPPAPTAASPLAQHITVSAPTIPLSGEQIAGLLRQRPDYGALADPWRRASCLSGLGYPTSAAILGARPVQMGDRPGVLLVLAGDGPADLVALVVLPNCSSADTGLIAQTQIGHP